MLEYVKICPKCGHATPESVGDICPVDKEFLGFVQAVPAPEEADRPQALAPPVSIGDDRRTRKICTKCSHPNEITANRCSNCGEPFTLVSSMPSETPVQTHSHPVTTRFDVEPSLWLELSGTSKVYEIKNGCIIGQAHPTSNAHVQIADVPGVNFVHRQHCSFDCINGQWFVTAIPQEHYTNPTFVNNQKLQASQRYPINNGDRLTMSNITFNVRIIQT
jgi:ribosomal protein L40E